MTKTVAQYDLASFLTIPPTYPIDTYGAMSYTDNGYGTGHLPFKTKSLYYDLIQRRRHVPTVYSYATPIAWYDSEFGVWVKPDVKYSITTSKHQGYLWKLQPIHIPYDCGYEEYRRFVSQVMIYRGTCTVPGPNFKND